MDRALARRLEARFREALTLFRDVGEGVNKTGEAVSGAADKLSDWLRNR